MEAGDTGETISEANILISALYISLIVGLCVAISWSLIGRWIADVVTPPGRGWVGLGGLIYLLAVAVLMVVILIAMWFVGRQFDPIARWFGPMVRRLRGRGGWPWRR
jgi:cation transporter-like permease